MSTRLRLLLALLTLCLPTFAAAQTYTSILVFGDSLSDTGNVAHLTQSQYSVRIPGPATGYTDGSFTDGTDTLPAATLYSGVWIKQLAATFPAAPTVTASLDGGTNYAYGFAFTGTGTSPLTLTTGVTVQVDNLSQQVDNYFATHSAIPPDTLVVVWAGANDIISSTSDGDLFQAAGAEVSAINKLINMGGNNLLLVNVPPLGLTPRFQSSSSVALTETLATLTFNSYLSYFLQQQFQFPPYNLKFRQLDTFHLLNSVVANPSSFDLVDAIHSARSTLANPDQSFFWDDLHPTTAGHHLVAAAAAAVLAAPAQGITMTLCPNATTATADAPYTFGCFIFGGGGSATLYDGLQPIQTVPLGRLQANSTPVTFTLPGLSAGTHYLSVYYSGTQQEAASYSLPAKVVFTASVPVIIPTATSLVATPGVIGTSTGASFAATVTAATGSATPTGTVTFFDGTTSLGTATLSASGTLASNAALSTAALTVGTHAITAVYAGDAAFAPSTSAVTSLNVAPPSISATLKPASVSVVAGSTATSTLTVTPAGGFNGSVSITCGSLPAYAACNTGSTSSVTFSTAHDFPITITTNGSTTAAAAALVPLALSGPGLLLGIIAAGSVFLLILNRRRAGRLNPGLLAVLITLSLGSVLGLSGCGGTSHKTAPGTYTIPITVTPSTGSATTATLTLIVQ